nr:reverse transcriptase domain-containing protein [Tanacetum cinerariifolium]
MAEFLRAPTKGYAEAIMVPPILAEQFKLKHSLFNMMTLDQFFELEKDNPHDHIRWFNKITSTIKHKDVPNSAIKLMLFPFSLAGAARRWLEKEPSRSILTWEDLVSKSINEFFPPQEQQITVMKSPTFNNGLMNRFTRHVKSNDANLNSSSEIAKLTHAVNQQTSVVTTSMTTILKHFQATPPPASVKAVEEICVIQGYVAAAAVNYNQGELKAITTQSGVVLDGPSVPIPSPFINSKKDERVEETLTDQDLAEYTIKVPPPLVQKSKPPSQRNFVVHQRDPLHPNIPYPLRMHKQKQQEKDEV